MTASGPIRPYRNQPRPSVTSPNTKMNIPAQISEIRVAPVSGEKSAIRIDYAAREPGSINRTHFATCVFGGATFERDRLDLVALDTDQGPLGEARLLYLKRFWLADAAREVG